MTPEILQVLGILGIMVFLFIKEYFPLDITALIGLSVFIIFGLVSINDAISGFSNQAVITIACLFVISHALQKSRILEHGIVRLNKLTDQSRLIVIFIFLLVVALASAFINNTAIVAIFIPLTIRLARMVNLSPSKLLIPLSYFAVIGGTLTLVGTSTNLLVNSIYSEYSSAAPLGVFEFSKFGIFKLIVGMIYIMFAIPFILPSRTVTSSLTKSYHMGGYLTELKVTEESPLVGKTFTDRNVNKNYDITVLDIVRNKKVITQNIRSTIILPGDILFVRGSIENFLRMKEIEKVTMLTDEKLTQDELLQENNTLVECILTEQSDLVGRTLLELNFRRRFGSFILAVRREGAILREKIAHIIMKAFDTLLVYGPKEKIRELSESGNFIILGEIETALQKHRFWWLSITILLGATTMAALGMIPIVLGVIIGLVILLIFRVISSHEMYQSINWQVIVLIGAMVPISIAIKNSGAADWLASLLLSLVQYFDLVEQPYVMLSCIYLLTMIITELISNSATAIIMTPIAISAALKLGLDPRPFVFTVCFAASASFITPIGYQTNMMVYGPGGYKFSDFVKVGLPLAVIFWILASWLIPVIWPFTKII